jgi:hypothetical protein
MPAPIFADREQQAHALANGWGKTHWTTVTVNAKS